MLLDPQNGEEKHRKEGKKTGKVRHLEGGLIWQERRKEDKEKGTGWRTWSLSKLHPNRSGRECREGALIITLASRPTMAA